MNPFEFLKSIQSTKINLMEQDAANEKSYVPFLMNKAMSYHYDCLSFVQDMNQRYHLEPRMQHDYLFQTIRGKRRPFIKSVKPEVHATLTNIQKVFGYSPLKAKDAMAILSPDSLMSIMRFCDTGGLSKTPKR
jgi:hypothetical protein